MYMCAIAANLQVQTLITDAKAEKGQYETHRKMLLDKHGNVPAATAAARMSRPHRNPRPLTGSATVSPADAAAAAAAGAGPSAPSGPDVAPGNAAGGADGNGGIGSVGAGGNSAGGVSGLGETAGPGASTTVGDGGSASGVQPPYLSLMPAPGEKEREVGWCITYAICISNLPRVCTAFCVAYTMVVILKSHCDEVCG